MCFGSIEFFVEALHKKDLKRYVIAFASLLRSVCDS